MCLNQFENFNFFKNTSIFGNHVISIFTDASIKFNNHKSIQHTVMGGKIVINTDDMRIDYSINPIKSDQSNISIDFAELCAIYHTLKILMNSKEIGNLEDIKQINVYSDNLEAVETLRNSLHKSNKMLYVNKQSNNIGKCSESLKQIAYLIHEISQSLKKPIYAFHVKAHMLAKDKIRIEDFIDSFAKENWGSGINVNDASKLMKYNNFVDTEVRFVNKIWNF